MMKKKFCLFVIITFILATNCQNHHEKSNLSSKRESRLLFFDFAVQKKVSNPSWGSVLQDIKQHETFYENNFEDPITTAHEATHDVSIHLRNKWENHYPVAINGFYCLENRAIILENPPIKLSQVYSFIPVELRELRYEDYFPNPGYENNPLYIWEEWNAYLNGAATGVDLVEKNLWSSKEREALLGLLEFQVYSTSFVCATEKLAPEYYQNSTLFKRFFIWNTKRTFEIYQKARKLKPFKHKRHEEYYNKIKTHPAAKEIRKILQETCGILF